MIKGVNRHIIEIADTGTVYFEKVLLFVKPEYCDYNINNLKREAENMLLTIDNKPLKYSNNKKLIKTSRKKFGIKISLFVVVIIFSAVLGAVLYKAFF